MQSNELKVKSFRVSQEVTDHLSRMIEERQVTTNQLFEELIQLADEKSPEPLLNEENVAFEATLNQIKVLFQERATRLEMQRQENERIKSKHRNVVESLESQISEEQSRVEEEYYNEVSKYKQELKDLQTSLEEMKSAKEKQEQYSKKEQTVLKEEMKQLKRIIYEMEGHLKKSEDERSQLYRQNQSLIDMIEDFKTQSHRAKQLEEENQTLRLEVQLLRHEKEKYDYHLNEQIELAVLRERQNKLQS